MTTSLNESLGGRWPLEWIYLFLIRLGVPRTLSNIKVAYSWMFWESGGGGGMYNPLNTVQEWPGATNYNSIGVKNYLTWEDGMAATETAIRQSRYTDIMDQLTAGDNSDALIEAITSSQWGTTVIKFRNLPKNPQEIDMEIQPGRIPTVAGMVPYATLAIDGQHVELWFGADLINSEPTSDPNLRLWRPAMLAISSQLRGIAKITPGNDPRTGIWVCDTTGRVHKGFWK